MAGGTAKYTSPQWHMLWHVDVGGTAGVLRGADMMARCRQGARQEHRTMMSQRSMIAIVHVPDLCLACLS
jgi:hypothetical protein